MAATCSGILSAILMVFCYYFTLSFFQYLKEGDARLVSQSKKWAVICLALSLLVSATFYI
ncbi:hypothetical protein [Bacillus sp. SG-1]|uniref:hypothetical protein n=1 Tax=Bacillus sp. SG-1 TaxID=161544 RepID=UPI00015430DD|nr:hypothetical protein [Bacillus sp. SG-1]EDL66476.1 hypothetical protein BSG1_03950 [Bacillus sp. SG-1]